MIGIVILLLQITVLLYFVGYGLTALFIPKNLKNDSIWIVPWVGTILISLVGITLSLAKIPMQYASIIILVLSVFFIIVSFIKNKFIFYFTKEYLIISMLIICGLVVNLFVLFNKVGFPSTISMLNTDPIIYSYTADFLVNHTLYDGNISLPFDNYYASTGTLIHSAYRWGTPIILSFFISILKVESYEIFTVLITLYFVFTFPLVYILAKLLTGKKNYFLLLLIFITYCLNSTLLYILYNAFFGQIIFNGLFVWITIIIFTRILYREQNKSLFNLSNFILAISLASTAAIYSDGLLLIISPFIIWALAYLIINKSYSALFFVLHIGLLVLLIQPIPIFLAVKHNFDLFLGSLQNTPPGWEYVRFATPLEMSGFYNLYYYKKLPLIINLLISLPIIYICLLGFIKAKGKLFLTAILFTFILLCTIFLLKNNFFLYLRTVTYTLFIFSILFCIGFISIFSLLKNSYIKIAVIIVIVFLSLRSADRTVRRFYWHTQVIDKSIVSLKDLNNDPKIKEPFFMPEIYLGEGNFWTKLWQEYMLKDKKIIHLGNYQGLKDFYPKKKLLLTSKKDKYIPYTNILWQNDYYILGEVKTIKVIDDLLSK